MTHLDWLDSELEVSSNSAVVEESPHEAKNCLASLTDLSHAACICPERLSAIVWILFFSVCACVVFPGKSLLYEDSV